MTDVMPSSPSRASLPPPPADLTAAGSSKSAPAVPSLNTLNTLEQLSPEARMRPLSLQRGLQRRGSLPKPRSNSSLTSSRPAPPSPAPSRPSSQVIDSPTASLHSVSHGFTSPGAGATSFGSSPGSAFGGSTFGGRDRSCSSASRRSLKARPKSLLGLISTPAATGSGLETAQEEEHERERERVDAEKEMEKEKAEAEEDEKEKEKAEEQDDEKKTEKADRKLGLGLRVDTSTGGATTPTDSKRSSHQQPSSKRSSGPERGSTPLTPATLSALNALSLDSGTATPRAPNPALEAEAALTRRVRVRDYAFVSTDLRFVGLGPQRSRSNWSAGEPEPSTPQPAQQEWGFGGFGAGFGLGATFGPSSGSVEPAAAGLSFGLGSWTKRDDEDVADHSASDYWSDDDELDEHDPDHGAAAHAVYYPPGNELEPDGLHRTAYAFAPEGINEIAIDVGEFLDVRGRGGGEGWVVGTRLRDGVEGLVPEGYLERCDEGDPAFEGEWEKVRQMRRSREAETPSSRSGNSENDEIERW